MPRTTKRGGPFLFVFLLFLKLFFLMVNCTKGFHPFLSPGTFLFFFYTISPEALFQQNTDCGRGHFIGVCDSTSQLYSLVLVTSFNSGHSPHLVSSTVYCLRPKVHSLSDILYKRDRHRYLFLVPNVSCYLLRRLH